MKRAIAIILISIAVFSCKSKAVLAEGKASAAKPLESIVENHYKNKKDFETVYIKSTARYEDKDNTQNVSAEIKIRKDEKILVSIRVLGITMAKALITPSSVQYYEKLNGEYFEGDYTTLSRWLGTDLDFQKVQNLLIGNALDDLTKGSYTTTVENKLYKLQASERGTDKSFYFEAEHYLMKKEEISQPNQQRQLTVTYPNHTQYPQAILPAEILIDALQKKGATNIRINYNTVTFNEELSFPYSVPDGYERIFID
jgi:hypothetical protein